MTLLTIVNDVAAVVGVAKMDVLFGALSSNRTAFELLALANEMAERIAGDLRDWTVLRKSTTIYGDGVSEAFNLPPDFRRLLTNSNVWRSISTITPMRFIPDTDEWNQRRVAGYAAPWGEWTIFGGQIHVWPIMDAGIIAWANGTAYKVGQVVRDFSGLPIDPPPEPADVMLWRCNVAHTSAMAGNMDGDRAAHPTYWSPQAKTSVRFSYLSRNIIRLSSALPPNNLSDRFANDGDTYVIAERVLRLGMIWQWKANKGSPYAEDMGTWEDAMSIAMGTDSPSPVLIGRRPSSLAASAAYPFEVPDGMVPL